MGVSYLAVVELGYGTNNVEVKHKFFTTKRAKKESPKTRYEADNWIAQVLREHGTQNVRCTLSRVEFCIVG